MAIARSVPVNGRHRPSHVVPGAPRRSLCPASVRNRLLGFPRHRGQIVICAASDKDGPKQPETTTPLIKAVRQLAGATAFAAVTLAAVVLRDKVTSPIIPPLLPRVERLVPDAASSTPTFSCPAAASAAVINDATAPKPTPDTATPSGPDTAAETAAVQQEGANTAAAAAAPAKRPVAASVLRAVVRPVWGTATLPLRLLDLMLFPDGDLIRPLPEHSSPSSAQQQQQQGNAQASPSAKPAAEKLPNAAPPAHLSHISSNSSSSTDVMAVAPPADAAAAAAPPALQSAAAAQLWAASLAHTTQNLLQQVYDFAMAPAAGDAAQLQTLGKPVTSSRSSAAAPLPAPAESEGSVVLAAAQQQQQQQLQAGSVPVAGLDVGSDVMSAEAVAALRAWLSSSSNSSRAFALPALCVLLTALVYAAGSRRNTGSLRMDPHELPQLPLPCYTWPGAEHNMPDIAHDSRSRTSSSSSSSDDAPAAASSSSSCSSATRSGSARRQAVNAGDLLVQLPIACYSPPDVMHQLPSIGCYQRQRSSSSSGQAASATSAEPGLTPAAAAAAGLTSSAKDSSVTTAPTAAKVTMTPPAPPASPTATAAAECEDDDEEDWCLSRAAAYHLLGGPPNRPTRQQQQQQQPPMVTLESTAEQQELQPAKFVLSSAGSASILGAASGSSSSGASSAPAQAKAAAAAAGEKGDIDEPGWCLSNAAAYSLLGRPPHTSSPSKQQQQPPADATAAANAAANALGMAAALASGQPNQLSSSSSNAAEANSEQQATAAAVEYFQKVQQQLTDDLSKGLDPFAPKAVAPKLQQFMQDLAQERAANAAAAEDKAAETSALTEQQPASLPQLLLQVLQLHADLSSWVRSHLPLPAALGAEAEAAWQQESEAWRQQQLLLQQVEQQLRSTRLTGGYSLASSLAGLGLTSGLKKADDAECFAQPVLHAVSGELRQKGVMLWQWRQRLQEHNPGFQPDAAAAAAEGNGNADKAGGSSVAGAAGNGAVGARAGSSSTSEGHVAVAAAAAVSAAAAAVSAAAAAGEQAEPQAGSSSSSSSAADLVAASAAATVEDSAAAEPEALPLYRDFDPHDPIDWEDPDCWMNEPLEDRRALSYEEHHAIATKAAQRIQQLLEQQQQLFEDLFSLLIQEKTAAVSGEEGWQLLQLAINNKSLLLQQLELLDSWLGPEDVELCLLCTLSELQRILVDLAAYKLPSLATDSKQFGAAAEAQWQQEWLSLQRQKQQYESAVPVLHCALDAPEVTGLEIFPVCGFDAGIVAADALEGVLLLMHKMESKLSRKQGLLQQWGWHLQQHNAGFRPSATAADDEEDGNDDDADEDAAADDDAEPQHSSSSSSNSRSSSSEDDAAAEVQGAHDAAGEGSMPAMQRVQQLLLLQQQLCAELISVLRGYVHDPYHLAAMKTLDQEQAWQLLQLAVDHRDGQTQLLESLEKWLDEDQLAQHLKEVLWDFGAMSLAAPYWRRRACSVTDDSSDDDEYVDDEAMDRPLGAKAEARWVTEWQQLQQQQQRFAAAEPLLQAAAAGREDLRCVRLATTHYESSPFDDGHEMIQVSIEGVMQKHLKTLAGKEAVLQRWGWRLQQRNPAFRPLDDESGSSSGSEGSTANQEVQQAGVTSEQPAAAAATEAPAAGDSAEQMLQSISGQRATEAAAAAEAEQAAAAAVTAADSQVDTSAATASTDISTAAGGSAEQMLQFINGQRAEAVSAAAEAEQAAAAAVAAANGTGAAATTAATDTSTAAGSNAQQVLQFIDEQSTVAAAAAAEAEQAAAAAVAAGEAAAAPADGTAADAAAGDAAVWAENPANRYIGLFDRIRRNKNNMRGSAGAADAAAPTAAAASSSTSDSTEAPAATAAAAAYDAAAAASAGSGSVSAEAGYAAAYQSSFPAAFHEAFEAADDDDDDAAADEEDHYGGNTDGSVEYTDDESDDDGEWSDSYEPSESDDDPDWLLKVSDDEDDIEYENEDEQDGSSSSDADARPASADTSSTSSSLASEAAKDSSSSSTSSSTDSNSNSSCSSDLLEELRALLGLQNASFRSQAYDAVAATTASTSSSAEVPHLVLLLCHALLQRGEDSERQLAAVVGKLAGSRHARLLPVMLAGAMASVFRAAQFDRPGSSPQLALRVLRGALPGSSFLALQQQLLMRGLLQELEVPCEWQGEGGQQASSSNDSGISSRGSEVAATAAAAGSDGDGDAATAAAADGMVEAEGDEQQASNSSSKGLNAAASAAGADGYDQDEDAATAAAADGLVDYGVYKHMHSSEEQQQQVSKPKARSLPKFAERKQRRQALQQQQQKQQQEDEWGVFSSYEEVGQYKPQSKWGSEHLNTSSSSSGSGVDGAVSFWAAGEKPPLVWDSYLHPPIPTVEEYMARAEDGFRVCADEINWDSMQTSNTSSSSSGIHGIDDEQRWQGMLREEQQWVQFAGLEEGAAAAAAAGEDDKLAASAAAAAAAAAGEDGSGKVQASAEQQHRQSKKKAKRKMQKKKGRRNRAAEFPNWWYADDPRKPDSMDDVCFEDLLRRGYFKD